MREGGRPCFNHLEAALCGAWDSCMLADDTHKGRRFVARTAVFARPLSHGPGVLPNTRGPPTQRRTAALCAPGGLGAPVLRPSNAPLSPPHCAHPPSVQEVDILLPNAGLALGVAPVHELDMGDALTMVNTNVRRRLLPRPLPVLEWEGPRSPKHGMKICRRRGPGRPGAQLATTNEVCCPAAAFHCRCCL